ncbi:unnamed protein product [Protopolystoma xenopodis]|uniref:Uncharacterized protein n=1 Tax=Protopolystoma xenopodis TaxID=117903 RepID=A0A3S5CPE0_9PLAT|nr:unnamed protein product [Protopolystoma xenopodis]
MTAVATASSLGPATGTSNNVLNTSDFSLSAGVPTTGTVTRSITPAGNAPITGGLDPASTIQGQTPQLLQQPGLLDHPHHQAQASSGRHIMMRPNQLMMSNAQVDIVILYIF